MRADLCSFRRWVPRLAHSQPTALIAHCRWYTVPPPPPPPPPPRPQQQQQQQQQQQRVAPPVDPSPSSTSRLGQQQQQQQQQPLTAELRTSYVSTTQQNQSMFAAPAPPPSSSFVLGLLRKYPTLCTAPFSDIVRVWMSAGPEIQSHVALEERQALNLHMPDPTTSKALYQERDYSPPRSGRGAGGTAERHFLVSHWAALHGFINVLDHLFASNNNGADTTAINKHNNFLTVVSDVGLLPVHYAARGGQLEALRMLLSQASVVTGLEYTTAGNTIATLAAQFGHVHILEWLNENITLRPLLWTGELTRQGRTPLHCGAQAGAVGVVQLYLNMHTVSSSILIAGEGGVEERRIDICDLHGHTLAHYAAESGRLPILELLHNQTSHHDDGGRTNNLKSCCSGMLRDVDKQGATLMHHAARHPPANNSIVAFLHQKVGLSLFEKDASGNSPAVWTVLGGKNYKHILCLRYMLEKNRGETLSTRTGEGQPLLTLVRGKHGTECSMFSEMRGMGFVEE